MQSLKILAIIPARSGSKSVVHKNIRKINNKPMLAYSIEHAKNSKYINRIIVSTDSEEYVNIAREYGAEVPFIRPAEYATDTALDLDVFKHALEYLKTNENYVPSIVVQLRPTYPIRDVNDIDSMIEMIIDDICIDSVRSMSPAKEIPYKMWTIQDDGYMKPVITDIKEAYNMPRQGLPKVYYQNACIDVIRASVITKMNSMSGDVIKGYEMRHNYDIDTEEEFRSAEMHLQIASGNKQFVFDIDGVIAQFDKTLQYDKAEPNMSMIYIVNKLYDMGNKIILFTARGYVTSIDWSEVTSKQMKDWGVKYHELKFGKPNADYYVDDRMLSMEDLYNIGEHII